MGGTVGFLSFLSTAMFTLFDLQDLCVDEEGLRAFFLLKYGLFG